MHAFDSGPQRSNLLLRALRICASIDRQNIQLRELERRFGLNDAETKRRALRWELAAFRFKSVLLKYVQQKAGFKPDQPRWPAGSGRISGQWSDGGTVANDHNDFSSQRRNSARGHHELPRANYEKLPLPPETRKVFDDATSGRLHIRKIIEGDPNEGRTVAAHQFDGLHRKYNRATRDLFERFMDEHSIRPEQMTPDHARSVLKLIEESRDPRIRNYHQMIGTLQRFHQLRTGGRGTE